MASVDAFADTLAFDVRSGVRSSRIQNERPCVAATRSSFFTTRSWMGVLGKFSCSDCQFVPPSNETYIPVSVPAYNKFFRTGSSRTACVYAPSGMPFVIFAHVLPQSVVL